MLIPVVPNLQVDLIQFSLCAGLAKAGGCGLIIYVEDIIEMIASDSDASTSVCLMCLLVVQCIVMLYHSGNVGCGPECHTGECGLM